MDLTSLPRGHVLLGADAPHELVLDAEALESAESIRRWVEGAYAYWLGDGTKGSPLGALGVRVLDEILAPTWALHRLVRGRIEDDKPELVAASREQALILNRTRNLRRLEVVGPAGSGKSMLAAEKARRLAHEGYRTLLVCFNQRLATSLIRELAEAPARAGLDVTTFHRLCERLGAEARVLPARPDPIPQGWWDETLPGALEAAIEALPDMRYHAVIVDEGQDFEARWFELLERLLIDPEDVFWVFHDPGQALIRTDVVADLAGVRRADPRAVRVRWPHVARSTQSSRHARPSLRRPSLAGLQWPGVAFPIARMVRHPPSQTVWSGHEDLRPREQASLGPDWALPELVLQDPS